jgi:hypothetical protein
MIRISITVDAYAAIKTTLAGQHVVEGKASDGKI